MGEALTPRPAITLEFELAVLKGARMDSFRFSASSDEFDISDDFHTRFKLHLALYGQTFATHQGGQAVGNERFELINQFVLIA